MDKQNALQKVIDKFGSQEKLAVHLGLSPMAITQWKKRGVPANKCLALQDASDGQVTCYELRPDLFPKPQTAA